jgi:hypothetical protein
MQGRILENWAKNVPRQSTQGVYRNLLQLGIGAATEKEKNGQ